MNFQDNLQKVRDLCVVLFFISMREITLYLLLYTSSIKHGTLKAFYFIIFFFFFHILGHCHPLLSYGPNFKSIAHREVSLICFRLFRFSLPFSHFHSLSSNSELWFEFQISSSSLS